MESIFNLEVKHIQVILSINVGVANKSYEVEINKQEIEKTIKYAK